MLPFKKKDKMLNPKSRMDYFLLGIIHGQELRKKYPRPSMPTYTPSKIIQPKQLT